MPAVPFASLSTKELVVTLTLLLLFAAAVALLLIAPRNQLRGRGGNDDLPIHSLGKQPIKQVELARNPADLNAVLLKGDRLGNVRDARAGNVFDTFLFIPAYSALLIVTGALVARCAPSGRVLFWIVLLVVAEIALADWAENAGIERTLRHIEANQALSLDDANSISYPSMLKWSLIGLLLVGLGGVAILQPPISMRGLGLVLLGLGAAQLYQMVMYFRERFAVF